MCETRLFFEAISDMVALDGRLTLRYCLAMAQDVLREAEIRCACCRQYEEAPRQFTNWNQPHDLLSRVVE